MTNSNLLPMIQDFPRWLAITMVTRDETCQNARWNAISMLASNIEGASVETLLRLAIKSRQQPSPDHVQKIRETFYAADNTFEMRGNDRELQVLAASTLAAAMTLSDNHAAYAATAVAATMINDSRKPNLPIDLARLSEAALARIGEISRKRPHLSSFTTLDVPKLDFEQAAAKGKEGSWPHVGEAFTLAADSARTAITAVVKRQARFAGLIDKYLRVQDEEVQMLWWLTGAHSLDISCRLDAVPVDWQPLLFAKELAVLTTLLPGPRSVRALLSRAGLKERNTIALKDVINAPDANWLETFMSSAEPSPVTTPIHFAIKRRLETGAGDAWVSGWAAATELPADLALSPLVISLHFYRERLMFAFAD